MKFVALSETCADMFGHVQLVRGQINDTKIGQNAIAAKQFQFHFDKRPCSVVVVVIVGVVLFSSCCCCGFVG